MKYKINDIIYKDGKTWVCTNTIGQRAYLTEYIFNFIIGGLFISAHDYDNPNVTVTTDHSYPVIGVLENKVDCCGYPTWDLHAIEKAGLSIPAERLYGTNVHLKKEKV